MAKGLGFYTIGSSGHEANALVAAAVRPTDPALLHYRSGAFYLARAQQVPGHDGVRDVLEGLLAAVDEPIAGGRHKVFGHHDLAVIPQTSTIASHLPRAVGVAFSDRPGRRARGRVAAGTTTRSPCAASATPRSTTRRPRARSTRRRTSPTAASPCPCCSCARTTVGASALPSPPGWVAASLARLPGLRYERADSTDPVGVYDAAEELADHVRVLGRPAVLHLRCVRYGGHAGSDVESAYRSGPDRRADLELDPIVATGEVLVAAGLVTPDELVRRALASRRAVRAAAESLFDVKRLSSAAEIAEPLAPRRPDLVGERVADADRPRPGAPSRA